MGKEKQRSLPEDVALALALSWLHPVWLPLWNS